MRSSPACPRTAAPPDSRTTLNASAGSAGWSSLSANSSTRAKSCFNTFRLKFTSRPFPRPRCRRALFGTLAGRASRCRRKTIHRKHLIGAIFAGSRLQDPDRASTSPITVTVGLSFSVCTIRRRPFVRASDPSDERSRPAAHQRSSPTPPPSPAERRAWSEWPSSLQPRQIPFPRPPRPKPRASTSR